MSRIQRSQWSQWSEHCPEVSVKQRDGGGMTVQSESRGLNVSVAPTVSRGLTPTRRSGLGSPGPESTQASTGSVGSIVSRGLRQNGNDDIRNIGTTAETYDHARSE